jgi:hypothetical protein
VTYLYDFKNKEFVVEDGKLIKTDDIRVWIEKILRTQKERFKIYINTGYGTEIEDLIIGHQYPVSFLNSELRREVEESLLTNPRIKSLINFETRQEGKELIIDFGVILNDDTRVVGTVAI